MRVAVVVSHPIQHFCPQYSSWAKLDNIEVKVFFASNAGLRLYTDKNFGRQIKWDNLDLSFSHDFLDDADGKTVDNRIDSVDLNWKLAAFDPQVVIQYGYSQSLQRRAISWASRQRIPVIMISDSELRTPRNILRRAFKRVAVPQIYNRIALFFTCGDANEAYLRHYGVGDERMIRCSFPIDRTIFDASEDHKEEARTRIRALLAIPASHRVILMAGKFAPWKRQKDLVVFANRMYAEKRDVSVILVGSGEMESELRSSASLVGPGCLVLPGFVQPTQLVEFYYAADLYVHCSSHEPHSLAISEAVYSGLPTILSDACGSFGPSDDLQVGRNGFTYRCGDVDDLERKITCLFDSSHLINMGRASTQIGRRNQNLAHGEALTQALEVLRAV